MTLKIDQPIVGWGIAKEDAQPIKASVIEMHEKLKRPDQLVGTTYKVKPPQDEHALYITINDIVLNEGTDHEQRRPFEIFINSKNLDHYQWVVGLTRVISAVFRKGGDIVFLVDELKAVFDPKGGFWKKGKFVPSLIAEIGGILEQHLVGLGMLQVEGLTAEQQAMIEEKKQAYAKSGLPDNATLCPKCNTKAVVILDGCQTCLECGDSKCG